MRRQLVLATAAALLLVGATSCSSGDDSSTATSTTAERSSSDSGSGSSAASSSSGKVTAVEVCPMVDAAAVTALGHSGAGEASSYDGPPGTAVGVCSFGSVMEDAGALVVQVETKGKDAIVDPIMTVLNNATGTEPAAAATPSGAKVYDVAVIPGGGGVGTTVAWKDDSHVVVAAQTGDEVAVAQLEAIVAGVGDQL